ncbi:MAG: ATP-dependent RNA helicase RhlB [Porticoccaceae bacterium]|nr:MAG: ATP-dependent RNA helicase RhlB [Porticoccaceae bacterium]
MISDKEKDADIAQNKIRFEDLPLSLELINGIKGANFEFCTPIQASSLPFSLNGRDVVGQAQTGTGKTAAFLITIIEDLLRHPIIDEHYLGEARAIVLAPTRELAIQIGEDAKILARFTNLNIHVLVGGVDPERQLRALGRNHCDILIGTPGRLLDFLRSKDIFLDRLEILVIDEADRMLDMGFIPQVRQLINQAPKPKLRQSLMFSATFSKEIERMVSTWTDNPIIIRSEPKDLTTKNIDQKIFLTAREEKFDVLYNLLSSEELNNVIIFANRRDTCRSLCERLRGHKFKVGLLSGEVPQKKRIKTLEQFKKGQINLMVATDVAGRGIHIDGVTHVINFELPEEPEDYVHRIGRTGRAGEKGTSISFACEDDAFLLEPIEALLNEKPLCTLPPEHLLKEAKRKFDVIVCLI